MYQNQYGETPYEDRTVTQHTTPTLYPPTPRKMPGLALMAITAGFLGLALGVASLTLFLSYRGTADAQIHQMQAALSQAQSSLSKMQSGNASSYDALNAKVSAMGAWNLICAQALESQDGPGTYYFPCASQKP